MFQWKKKENTVFQSQSKYFQIEEIMDTTTICDSFRIEEKENLEQVERVGKISSPIMSNIRKVPFICSCVWKDLFFWF